MIRPLRRRHLGMVLTLALVAPVLLALGLARRAPIPTVAELPAVGTASPVAEYFWREDLWNGIRIRTGWAQGEDGILLALEPLEDVDRPDSLLYYLSAPFAEVGLELPDGVVLLGSFSGSRTVVRKPDIEGERVPGRLILYDLADHQVVGSAPLAALAQEAGS